MNVKHISAREHAGHFGFTEFIHLCAACYTVKRNACAARQLVFRNETDRIQDRVAFDVFFCAGNRIPLFIHLGDRYAGDALFAVNLQDRVRELERNIEIV